MISKDIKTTGYWLHIGIIVGVLLFLLKTVFNHDMLTFDFFWKISILVALGDYLAHKVMKI